MHQQLVACLLLAEPKHAVLGLVKPLTKKLDQVAVFMFW